MNYIYIGQKVSSICKRLRWYLYCRYIYIDICQLQRVRVLNVVIEKVKYISLLINSE